MTLDILLKPRPPQPPSPTSAVPTAKQFDGSRLFVGIDHKSLAPEFAEPIAWARSVTAAVTPSVTLFDGQTILRPVRIAFALMRLSLSPTAAREEIVKAIACAGRLAGRRFPTFISLDSKVASCPAAGRLKHAGADTSTANQQSLARTARVEVYPLIERGQFGAAIARIDRLMANTKVTRDQLQLLLVLEGQLYFSLNETQKAVSLLDQAISLAPGSESARRARNAKYELARLLHVRAPGNPPEPQPSATNAAMIPRRRRLRVGRPTILAARSAACSQANLTLGAGVSLARGGCGE